MAEKLGSNSGPGVQSIVNLTKSFVIDSLLLLVHINPVALRKAKTAYNFGLSECNRVKSSVLKFLAKLYYNFFYITTSGTH